MAGVAFIAFGLCASSVYLLNDLLDLASDRQHPRKRLRPFASGSIPLQHGLLLIPVLLIPAVLVSLVLPPQFLGVLGVYYVVTLAYSLGLKKVVLVDVLLLAVLYTLRIIAGAAAISLVPSFWILAFSMFLFLSLAMIKRYTELLAVCGQNDAPLKGRGYKASDMQVIQSMGTASGYLAVLVLAFYINSDMVGQNFAHPEVIWLLCPLLLYWISRMWLGAARDKMHDDPLVFAVKDRVSRWVGLLVVVVFSVGALL
jgi:4-hydroxybenzoate polyprenyltransferase